MGLKKDNPNNVGIVSSTHKAHSHLHNFTPRGTKNKSAPAGAPSSSVLASVGSAVEKYTRKGFAKFGAASSASLESFVEPLLHHDNSHEVDATATQASLQSLDGTK